MNTTPSIPHPRQTEQCPECLQWSERRWSEEADKARNTGDTQAIQDLVTESFRLGDKRGDSKSRLKYNDFLDVTDQILHFPEVQFAPNSETQTRIEAFPQPLRDYFMPQVAPDWIDSERLHQASRVWTENMIPMLMVLYASSLPSCYLAGRGIPALFATGKLRRSEYISQRLYETALMIDDVMKSGGISCDPDLPGEANDGLPRRYLWGPGYIAAKKVRLLHESVRHHLLNPPPSDEGFHWDSQEYYTPINQLDLAYTLLTFGYCLTKGAEHWGVRLSESDRDAMIHLWRVVGHLMGVQEQYLADSWKDATAVYHKLQKTIYHPTHESVALTNAVRHFVSGFLPLNHKHQSWMATALIYDQMGPDHSKVLLPSHDYQAQQSPLSQLARETLLTATRAYHYVRDEVFEIAPGLRSIFVNAFAENARIFYHSFRAAVRRDPFDFSKSIGVWTPKQGANEAFRKELKQWRHRLFRQIVGGIGLFVVSLGLTPLSLILFLSVGPKIGFATLAAALVAGVSSLEILNEDSKTFLATRPKPTHKPNCENAT